MIGKLTSSQLKEMVFKHLVYKRPEVLIRPAIGEDCAAVDFGEEVLIISTDPITGTASEVGKLAVNINLNDIASNGVVPFGLMLTILAPVGTSLEEIEMVIAQAAKEAEKNEVEIIGGHTEITDAVNRIVVSAVAIGKQPKSELIRTSNIAIDDVILMTKSVGLEGTGIIAFEKESELVEAFGVGAVIDAKALLEMTSVVKEGVLAGKFDVHAMHDITEGGLLGAVWELCDAANLGCIIDTSAIPIESITAQICDYYEIDPLRLISSGSLLIIASEVTAELVMKKLGVEGVNAQIIGKIVDDVCLIDDEGELFEITPPEGDALYDVLS
jgi:hydrogenase expression/formation protein HypE